jgi:hypothetical protein
MAHTAISRSGLCARASSREAADWAAPAADCAASAASVASWMPDSMTLKRAAAAG